MGGSTADVCWMTEEERADVGQDGKRRRTYADEILETS